MTRAEFTGPINSSGGLEINNSEVINTDSIYIGDVGDEDNPVNVYGYLSGAFSGNVAITVSTELSTALPVVSAGSFRLYYTTSSGLILKTADGVIGKINITT